MKEGNYLKNSAPWVPYKVPAIVERDNSSDSYALGWDHALADAHPDPTNTNPTKFLKWKKVLPSGENLGDILYWDPEAGDNGEWVVFPAVDSPNLRVLTIQNNTLAWTPTQDC